MDEPELRAALAAERAASAAQIASLQADFDAVVAASEASNADDEHDPEGATIAFERAQLAALLEQAHRRLADVEDALERVGSGGYGTCASCGAPIGAERLAARPSTRACIDCAQRSRR